MRIRRCWRGSSDSRPAGILREVARALSPPIPGVLFSRTQRPSLPALTASRRSPSVTEMTPPSSSHSEATDFLWTYLWLLINYRTIVDHYTVPQIDRHPLSVPLVQRGRARWMARVPANQTQIPGPGPNPESDAPCPDWSHHPKAERHMGPSVSCVRAEACPGPLGTSSEGWTRRTAHTELQNILADVRRGIWCPVEPEPSSPTADRSGLRGVRGQVV